VADRISILRRVEAEESHAPEKSLKAWLARKDTRLLSEEPARVTVFQTSHVWRVRLEILRDQGRPLHGAEKFLANLDRLTGQKKLEQFSFTGSELAGEVFFEQASGKFVGSVMVDYAPMTTHATPHELESFA
jgi:hypothetical protein